SRSLISRASRRPYLATVSVPTSASACRAASSSAVAPARGADATTLSPSASQASPTGSGPTAASCSPGSAGRLPPPHTRPTNLGRRPSGPSRAELAPGAATSAVPQARVEDVPYRVSEQVEPHHREEDGDAGEYRHPRRP